MSASARSLSAVIDSGYIEFAIYKDFPPYSFVDKENKPQGIDIALGKAIAKRLGLEPRWFWFYPDENLEDDLRNSVWKGGKINRKIADVMLRVPYDSKFSYAIDGYGLPKNNMVVMSSPYHSERWAVARDPDKTNNSDNLAIFRFEKIAVEIDTLPDFFLSSTYRGSLQKNVVHFSNISEAVDALKNGEVAAVMGMQSQIHWELNNQQTHYTINSNGLEQLSNKQWDIGIAVRHDFRQLSYKIGDIINELIEDKTIETIFKQYKAPYVMPLFYTDV